MKQECYLDQPLWRWLHGVWGFTWAQKGLVTETYSYNFLYEAPAFHSRAAGFQEGTLNWVIKE
jgi:hypothetical protein